MCLCLPFQCCEVRGARYVAAGAIRNIGATLGAGINRSALYSPSRQVIIDNPSTQQIKEATMQYVIDHAALYLRVDAIA